MNYKIKPAILFCLIAIFGIEAGSASTAFHKKKAALKKTAYIKIRLNSAAPFKVSTAALKYNKHLAFSFTLDDGYRSAYACAFPLLNGGHISPSIPDEWHNDQGGDGKESKGLFFSDGNGNPVAFKLGLAINAASIGSMPLNRGHLSWPEVKEMYNAGWDILNHGYHHATKHGTDFNTEVIQNIKAVKEQLGFTMSQFVVPGGAGDPGYEHEYEKDALNSGSFAVASYQGIGPVFNADNPGNLQSIVYARDFIRNPNKDTINMAVIDAHLKTLDSLMQQPQAIWYNEFSHGVGNTNLWTLSLFFPEFKYYMTTMAEKYGVSGADNIWMAPWQEVYEYIWLRSHTQITATQKGRDVVIKLILPEIPATFRYAAVTLKVQTNVNFKVIASSTSLKVEHNSKQGGQLLNINLK